jgi:hypothetical protein
MGLQMLIMPNKKLYVLITYMVLGPLAPWAPGGRTACPPLRAGPAVYAPLLAGCHGQFHFGRVLMYYSSDHLGRR